MARLSWESCLTEVRNLVPRAPGRWGKAGGQQKHDGIDQDPPDNKLPGLLRVLWMVNLGCASAMSCIFCILMC